MRILNNIGNADFIVDFLLFWTGHSKVFYDKIFNYGLMFLK